MARLDAEVVWKKKYENDLEEAKKMSSQEKFNLLMQLNSIGLILMDIKNKEKKNRFYQRESELRKKSFIEFIQKKIK